MSLRQDWKFPVATTRLLEAAEKEAAHHASRLAFWSFEREVAEKKLRTEGLSFRDQPVTGGMRLDVILDPNLQARVNECTSKAREHLDAKEGYERWVRALRGTQEAGFTLDVQDLAYFGL